MQQNIITDRLVLRPFRQSDSQRVALLAGEKIIADMTANIPHPYKPEMAKEWIARHQPVFEQGKGIVYAITLAGNDDIIGAVSFPSLNDGLGVLGYWIGVPYWGKGYAFEASKALIEHCKRHLGLNQVEVLHLKHNNRSRSVINKLGVTYIEDLHQEVHGKPEVVCLYRSKI